MSCCWIRKLLFDKNKENINTDENFINKLKIFDLIMIGYKKHSKIIDKTLVKKILNKRKQKPILFVDCGIPGNIKTDIGQIPNCFLFDLNDLIHFWASNSFALWVIRTIEAVLLLWSGICINLWIEILYFARIFVIEDKTPGLSLTSNLK